MTSDFAALAMPVVTSSRLALVETDRSWGAGTEWFFGNRFLAIRGGRWVE
ncbi:MAG: hypothetical protein ACK4IT_08170 [Thioalkalivibrionaceae bacterium]